MPMANTPIQSSRLSSASKQKQVATLVPPSTTIRGFPLADWLAAKDEARSILIDTCKVLGVITYTDLVESIQAITISADDFRLRFLLEEISVDEDRAGRGLLSAVVVHSGGDTRPGNGFFEMAAKRGRNVSNLDACWINELIYVHRQWSK